MEKNSSEPKMPRPMKTVSKRGEADHYVAAKGRIVSAMQGNSFARRYKAKNDALDRARKSHGDIPTFLRRDAKK